MSPRLSAVRSGLVIRLGILLGLGVLLFYYLGLFKFALIDDTYITLQYARTLFESGHWGFSPDQATNTATSPLNVILTTLAAFAAPSMVDAVIWLTTAELVLMFLLLAAISKKIFNGYYLAMAAFLMIASNPLILSTVGLESILYALLLTASLALFLYRRWIALAVSLALLTMTRPDGALLFVVMFFMLCSDQDGKEPASETVVPAMLVHKTCLLFGATYVLCLMPWELFSWFHFHSFLPDTLSIKMRQTWGPWSFSNGIFLYLEAYPVQAAFSFLVMPFALFAIFAKRREAVGLVTALFLFGLLHFIGYSSLKVPPYHWYYVPMLVSCILMGALGAATLFYADGSNAVRRTLLLALPAVFTVGIALFLRAGNLVPTQAPIHTNWATAGTYKDIGLWLQDHVGPSEKVKLGGEIGTLSYYSRRKLIDRFSCKHDCGQPYVYYLDMYNHPVNDREIKGTVIQQWPISTSWVPEGRIVLRQ